ncbi:putative spore protein YtfJ [Catenuloplanes nepalensis]|uniref:Spore protein YtfJ n=1 Tax=Catenuloplanes nepalensis TaxID=587533 RepID=A0ABT9MUM8_9ACTN|nr:hypothetical protein [Catenuloplanes nepalensis]MDP9795130.1 putative spore protein YtfJ [Catenuloplanes nepalensis]
MNVYEIMTAARDAMTVRRVFGDPYERDGVTIIPAALVAGGLGAGSGRIKDPKQDTGGTPGAPHGKRTDRHGDGGGFGMAAIPAGAYSIRAGKVRWHPAINIDLLILASATVTTTWLITRALTTHHRR